jgi:hypothetical protein
MKPILHLTGEERNAFDFIPRVRGTLRSMYNYTLSPRIERELVSKARWQDREYCLSILGNHFTIAFDLVIEPVIKKELSEKQKISFQKRRKTDNNSGGKNDNTQTKNDNTRVNKGQHA